MRAKNIPYVKMYDEDKNLLNPIDRSYVHTEETSRAYEKRMKEEKRHRFIGNGKSLPLVVNGVGKFLKIVQYVPLKDKKKKFTGMFKRICRYQPV